MLQRRDTVPIGDGPVCARCNQQLGSFHVIGAAIATIALLGAALALAFISLRAGGLAKDAGLIDAMEAAGGAAWPLTLAVGAAIAAIPMLRAGALLYVLTPIRFGFEPLRGARAAFRLALELRPWSMVEIFIIGVVVALVKVADLASVHLGSAFWIFVGLACVAFYEDAALCRRAVWRMRE